MFLAFNRLQSAPFSQALAQGSVEPVKAKRHSSGVKIAIAGGVLTPWYVYIYIYVTWYGYKIPINH